MTDPLAADTGVRRFDWRRVGASLLHTRSTSLLVGAMSVFIIATALDAYSVGPVPIQWIASCAVLLLLLFVLLTQPVGRVPNMRLFALFGGWCLVVTAVQVLLHDYAALMPSAATSSYGVFVALRFAAILAFAAAAVLTYTLLRHGRQEQILRVLAVIGLVISLAALYIYMAQVYGLPELPRTRLGTEGVKVTTVTYTYAFHRATGTFREPSHLAVWLIVPFFASIALKRSPLNVPTVVMGGTLLLTGSMTGIAACVLGVLGALVLARPRGMRWAQTVGETAVAVLLAFLIFQAVAVPNEGGSTNLISIIRMRLWPVAAGGLAQSNRSYVYEFAQLHPAPLLGWGLGHAQLLFSQYLRTDVPASFLNLYLSILYAGGFPGLTLLLFWLARPLLQAGALGMRRRVSLSLVAAISGYVAWLAMFYVQAEELTPVFGIVFAWLVYEIEEERESRRQLQ